MDLELGLRGSEPRFARYVEAITSVLGHADRAAPFRSYCAELLLLGDRKSIDPMAPRVQPGRTQATHQSLHHFVAEAHRPDDAVHSAVRARVLPVIERRGPIRALIIDDTGMPEKGKYSIGVARQYCGQLGKQDTCPGGGGVSQHCVGRRELLLPRTCRCPGDGDAVNADEDLLRLYSRYGLPGCPTAQGGLCHEASI